MDLVGISLVVMVCGNDLKRQGEEMLSNQRSDKGVGGQNCLTGKERKFKRIHPNTLDIKSNGRSFAFSDL